MQLLDDHLWELYDNGLITLDEVLDKARNPGEMLKLAEEKAGKALKGQRLDEDYGPIIKTS